MRLSLKTLIVLRNCWPHISLNRPNAHNSMASVSPPNPEIKFSLKILHVFFCFFLLRLLFIYLFLFFIFRVVSPICCTVFVSCGNLHGLFLFILSRIVNIEISTNLHICKFSSFYIKHL